jgi:probable phosphoglycerate mutase
MIVYLVRHGQGFNTHRPEGEPAPENPSLTPTGIAQARAVGARLRALGIDRLVASPLRRAVETALIVGDAVDLPVEVLGCCHEHRKLSGYLAWGGHELRARYPSLHLLDGVADDDWPYGEETLETAFGRADTFLGWLRAAAQTDDARRIAVVTHGAFTRIVLARVLAREALASDKTVAFDHTSVTTLRLTAGGWDVLDVNDASHLAG